jgi:hypothetical protein
MINPYAKIQNGLVVNTQMIGPDDYLDPAFIWADISGLSCADGSVIQIGCAYDGASFTQPS